MRILSMTATFGKLSRQTLTFEPGMNLIEAPNEWGKSTWCAFIMAMLYGIDTGARSKTGVLADKEHYAPWSGEPMSGRMDILWNGREITIERQAKGRTPLGEVKAYETKTGIPVPELSVAAPGQVLLGVEKTVFARSGFLRQAEMPVTEDESLRRRLNELVTTADESGASDDLAQKLKDLKNRCRHNKTGLLPEQEGKLRDLENKLQQLAMLQQQAAGIAQQQDRLKATAEVWENHKQALEYAEHLQYAEKLTQARESRDAAALALTQAETACTGIPAPEKLQQALVSVQQLRQNEEDIRNKEKNIPPMPQQPMAAEPFRGKTPDAAIADARADKEKLHSLEKQRKNPMVYLGIGAAAVGLVLLILQPLAGVPVLLAGVALLLLGVTKQNKLKVQIARLAERYRGISPDRWEAAATEFAQTQRVYAQALAAYQQAKDEINRQQEENDRAVAELTGGESLTRFEEGCRLGQQKYNELTQHQAAAKQAEAVLQTLSATAKAVEAPKFEDTLSASIEETERILTQTAAEQHSLQQRLGQCQGQMESIGKAEHLQQEKAKIQARIADLELHYRALVRAQETLVQATQELQRRFAPRISQRAQNLFGRLTGHRYNRLSLLQDLSVEAGAEGENTLRSTLWRSDGTVDQLYLALRLAVAEELTPNAPIILDDALVRFDDTRMRAALNILREMAENKQIILFTCQSRERNVEETK